MKTPETSALFENRTDVKSGAVYYVLTKRVASYQQGFYFVNNSMTKDGRYLWMYCSFPSSHKSVLRMLGVIDFEKDELNLLPDTLFSSASPYIDPDTGDAYFTWGKVIYKRSPQKEKPVAIVAEIPIKGYTWGMATHLTMSPDKKEFFLDIREGNRKFYVGSVNLETGVFQKWVDSDFCLNHAQFHPTNPDLALCAYDHYFDTETGEKQWIPSAEDGTYLRLWTVTRDGKKINHPANDNYATHEWWSHDGKKIYYCNPNGIQRLNIENGEHINIHNCHPWHAYSGKEENFYVFDQMVFENTEKWYRGMPAKVTFYNAVTDKEIDIVSYMPNNEYSPENPCDYHIDPHPRFSENEKYVIFTTSELGGADLAVASVADLLQKTSI